MNSKSSSWSFFIDTGGTFTDCLAHDPNGKTPLPQNPIFAYPNQTMQDIEPLLKQAPLGSLILVSRNQRYLGLFTSSDAAQSQKNEDELANS